MKEFSYFSVELNVSMSVQVKRTEAQILLEGVHLMITERLLKLKTILIKDIT